MECQLTVLSLTWPGTLDLHAVRAHPLAGLEHDHNHLGGWIILVHHPGEVRVILVQRVLGEISEGMASTRRARGCVHHERTPSVFLMTLVGACPENMQVVRNPAQIAQSFAPGPVWYSRLLH
jgi:hypothetical protein